jgi:hypothetical protein
MLLELRGMSAGTHLEYAVGMAAQAEHATFVGHLAAVLSSATEFIFMPDIKCDHIEYARRVLVSGGGRRRCWLPGSAAAALWRGAALRARSQPPGGAGERWHAPAACAAAPGLLPGPRPRRRRPPPPAAAGAHRGAVRPL